MLKEQTPEEREETWRGILTGPGCEGICAKSRRIFGVIPATERCKNCNAPFTGAGAVLMRQIGRGRYDRNPRFCNH